MAVSVDQAGKQGLTVGIDADGPRRVRVLNLGEGLHDLAVVADQQGLESLQLAVGADLDAVGVVDQRVGRCGGGEERRQQREQRHFHGRAHSIV
jgi:hypothetical protein